MVHCVSLAAGHVQHAQQHLCTTRKVLTHLGGIDNAHVHASFAGMVQEGAVEAAPHRLVAPEGEGNVGHPPTDLAPRALPLDLPGGTDEIHSIVVVLRHASADSEDVGVEDDVLRVETHLLHQDSEGSGADAHLVLSSGCLQCGLTGGQAIGSSMLTSSQSLRVMF